MTPAAYLEMADTEDRHWWFVARREILAAAIERLGLPDKADILEVGSGTSGNLDMLARYGRVSAIEMDDTARRIANEKTGGRYDIRAGMCPQAIPFTDERFDLICLFDVLEHIEDAPATLAALGGLLKPGGRIVVTVPAFGWMWSAHDEFLHHKRRYTASLMRAQAAQAGLTAERATYFNMFLFPLAAAARLADKAMGRSTASGAAIPSPLVNRLFRAVFASERHVMRAFDLPFGVSLLAVLRAR